MTRDYYETPFGTLLLIANRGALVYCNWMSEECDRKLALVERSHNERDLNHNDNIENVQAQSFQTKQEEIEILEKVKRQLEEYFAGSRQLFEMPLRFRGTPFQEKVWGELKNIKYGETITYKDLAMRIGNPKAFRAVASACGSNPICIFAPCHRVVASGGGIGGYTGGIDKKMALLSIETSLQTLLLCN